MDGGGSEGTAGAGAGRAGVAEPVGGSDARIEADTWGVAAADMARRQIWKWMLCGGRQAVRNRNKPGTRMRLNLTRLIGPRGWWGVGIVGHGETFGSQRKFQTRYSIMGRYKSSRPRQIHAEKRKETCAS